MRDEAVIAVCMVAKCIHNLDNQCHAPDVNVGFAHGHADCATFAQREEAA